MACFEGNIGDQAAETRLRGVEAGHVRENQAGCGWEEVVRRMLRLPRGARRLLRGAIKGTRGPRPSDGGTAKRPRWSWPFDDVIVNRPRGLWPFGHGTVSRPRGLWRFDRLMMHVRNSMSHADHEDHRHLTGA